MAPIVTACELPTRRAVARGGPVIGPIAGRDDSPAPRTVATRAT